jgi:hypothetical protein
MHQYRSIEAQNFLCNKDIAPVVGAKDEHAKWQRTGGCRRRMRGGKADY